MLGSAEEWFYRRLGGMDVDLSREDRTERLTIHPVTVIGVDWVRCGFDSVLGKIESDWKREGNVVRYTITVPVESTVVLPNGAKAKSVAAKRIGDSGADATFRVSAGTWEFTARRYPAG